MTQDRPTNPQPRRSTLDLLLLSDFGRLNPERARVLARCEQATPPRRDVERDGE